MKALRQWQIKVRWKSPHMYMYMYIYNERAVRCHLAYISLIYDFMDFREVLILYGQSVWVIMLNFITCRIVGNFGGRKSWRN